MREGMEHWKAIILRSGKSLEKLVEDEKAEKEEKITEDPLHGAKNKHNEVAPIPNEPALVIPFP